MRIIDLSSNNMVVYPESVIPHKINLGFSKNKKKYIIALNEKTGSITGVYRTQDLLQCYNDVMPDTNNTLKERASLRKLENLGLKFTVLPKNSRIEDIQNIDSEIIIVLDESGQPISIIDQVRLIKMILKYVKNRYSKFSKRFEELLNIFFHIDEEIFVTDNTGLIKLINPSAERVCGVNSSEVVGRNVQELEQKKVMMPSIALEVINRKKKVNMMQEVKTGKTVLGTGVPVFDENGDLYRVICTSKDVLQINKIKEELERKNQEIALLRQEIRGNSKFIYSSKKIKDIKDVLLKVAPTNCTVLIQGETGVGKDIIAHIIHYLSKKNQQPFIKINCANLPESLLESELFGYERGAFTGANQKGKKGKIELANHGTLFLDEIGELPLSLQSKLLEFLQDKVITPIGGTKQIPIDTRVIAATNRDLYDMVNSGKFRSDLYYRLNVIPIYIPPLRERRDDIITLANYFLNNFNKKYNHNRVFSSKTIDTFMNYNWPGNVRELKHLIERAVIINSSNIIDIDNLQQNIPQGYTTPKIILTEFMPLKIAKNEVEKILVTRAYDMYKSTYKAADVLGVHQSTVSKILKKIQTNKRLENTATPV